MPRFREQPRQNNTVGMSLACLKYVYQGGYGVVRNESIWQDEGESSRECIIQGLGVYFMCKADFLFKGDLFRCYM